MTEQISSLRKQEFQHFEDYKKKMGLNTSNEVDTDKAFHEFIELYKKGKENSSFLKKLFFEALPYRRYFTFDQVIYISFKLEIDKTNLTEWFTEFLVSGAVRRVSKNVFKRMSKFRIKE